ncbi:MAG TPA: hypothetical protein DCP32_01230 [Anaerolineaceae bacterium]|nr:MAG: hypothetical protein A2X24_11220 [Chloroflexi bacterium GWB2_54_36]HAL15406.1 hypothetical protein [Anaerolineaceae bacterium]HBA91458.1 hypothetical protein [Anaerolineaceae bacterium]
MMQADLSQISGIEKDLYGFFRSIDPDPDFINALSHRLSRTDQTVLGRPIKSSDWMVWLGLGFLAGLIIWRVFGGQSKK